MPTSTFPRFVFIAVIVFLGTGLASAQNVSEHTRVVEALNLLDLWLDAQTAYQDLPGVSAAIIYDQELIWSSGYGLADVENQIPATPETMYSICSISKLFTSVGVMQLRDEGKFRLDDDLGSILPWFDLEQKHPEGGTITLEGILTHSSGLPRESDYPYWADPFEFPTHDQLVDRLSSQETLYPARKYYQYSNLGLSLAGEVVAEVSGQSFARYMRANILDPLGMTSTVSEIGTAWNTPNMAAGYGAKGRDGKRRLVHQFEGNAIAPAMGFASTVNDLAKFASWQFELLAEGGNRILEANTLREMHRVHWIDPDWETTRGLGFGVLRRGDKTFVRHGGSCPGFRTEFLLQTDDKIGTVVMINAGSTDPGLFARRAYELIAPALKTAKSSTAEREVMPADFEAFLGVYDSFPWGGESVVIPWQGGIAAVSFPTSDPLNALMKLKHIEGNRFRRIRDDDSLREEIVFDTDPDGKVLRVWRHSTPRERIN